MQEENRSLLEDYLKAKKYYLESDIEGIYIESEKVVSLKYLDLLKLMDGYAKECLKK
jgi:hypothetical protein